MTFAFLAGRSSLRQLHQTVQRNILRQHRRNVRYESSKPTTNTNARNASTVAEKDAETGAAGIFTGAYWASTWPARVPLRAYGNMQKRSPLLTQLESSLIIYFLGDLSAQTVQTSGYTNAPYEPIRGLRALIIGGIISIPSFKWFLWLGRNFNYSSHLLSLGVKILVGQCLFTPIFNTYFFGMQTLLAGGSFGDAVERVKNTVPVSWKNSWKLWPMVTAFTFTFIQPNFRSVFTGIIAIGWQTYLTWLNTREERRKAAEREDPEMKEKGDVKGNSGKRVAQKSGA